MSRHSGKSAPPSQKSINSSMSYNPASPNAHENLSMNSERDLSIIKHPDQYFQDPDRWTKSQGSEPPSLKKHGGWIFPDEQYEKLQPDKPRFAENESEYESRFKSRVLVSRCGCCCCRCHCRCCCCCCCCNCRRKHHCCCCCSRGQTFNCKENIGKNLKQRQEKPKR